MSAARLLTRLRAAGIELRSEGDRVVVNAPKGALTEALGDEIRRNKQELLTFLRLGAESLSPGGRASGRIARAAVDPGPDGVLEARASFGQRRLFYLDQLEPGLPVYNVPVAFHLAPEVDVERLERALMALVSQHDALRTTLALSERGVVQRVHPEPRLPITTRTLDDPASLATLLEEHAKQPFDLVEGPLVRALIVRLPSETVLLFSAHHVVTDGWSQDVFESELSRLYDDPTAPRESPAVRYVDYAEWQHEEQKEPSREPRVAFWRQLLARPLPVLELPQANARPQIAPTEGETESLLLPADLVEPLTALGRRDGATLFMVLLAAYATLLARVSGQTEVVIGTPVANRAHAETMETIGYFANTLALRVDLSGSPSFRELLRRVRELTSEAFERQDIPFEELVEVLEVERDTSRSPIFQTIFAFEDALPNTTSVAEGRSLRVTRRETIHAKVARTDLSAWVSAGDQGLLVTFEYPTALFDRAAVRRLLDHFRVALRAIADGADGNVFELPLLSREERSQILEGWNQTDRALPELTFAHELFEREAARGADRTALTFGERALSYRELERGSNQLAHHLAQRGVGPGALVGVFLERSIEMVASLLAVLKAGGAYVPIDPEYPADRIALMIEDSGLRTILTSRALRDRLPREARVVLVDDEAGEIGKHPADAPALARGEGAREHPAYVIYTSGSTGRPKGVVVPHRALLNFLCSMARTPGLTAEDKLVAVTTLSFDIAGLELFLPLSVGACVVLASRDQAADGSALRELVERSGATVMQATPSTWRMLLAAGFQGGPALKALCGGEAFPPDLARELCAKMGAVFNMYGPTETTIWSTVAKLDADDPRLTIGRPIDNTRVYILDPLGQPTPPGVPGELVIGGAGVALGYLQRPELTSARFVPDPFSKEPGRTMYKTGDLAAFRDDGQIVYHRRLDFQVKVRGHRIELGEIETVLGEHHAIERCVVIVREDRPGDARITAYYVPQGDPPTASELRKHLRTRLPDYMIPQHLVDLPALPLTPAGKIDRKALPAPAGALPAREARAPSGENELLIANIWREALGGTEVFAGDNFFDVGGHSLLSMVVIAKLEAASGHRFKARELLENSLEQLARALPNVAPKTSKAPAPAPAPRAPEPKPATGLLSRLKGKLFG